MDVFFFFFSVSFVFFSSVMAGLCGSEFYQLIKVLFDAKTVFTL